MKKISITFLSASAILLSFTGSNIATAHTFSGVLGMNAGATDNFRITCFDDGRGPPAKFITKITMNTSTSTPLLGRAISLQARRPGGREVTNTSDIIPNDNISSPLATLAATAGYYDVTIDKSFSGTATYTVNYDCLTSSGVHAGTTAATATQNQ